MGRKAAAVKADFVGMDEAAAARGHRLRRRRAGRARHPREQRGHHPPRGLDRHGARGLAARALGQPRFRLAAVAGRRAAHGGARLGQDRDRVLRARLAGRAAGARLCREQARRDRPHPRALQRMGAPAASTSTPSRPGYTATDNTQALRDDPDRSRGACSSASRPAASPIRPKSPVPPSFSSSDAATYCHGSVVTVDGGWLAR